MAVNYIAALLDAMAVAGMWHPEWQHRWATQLYSLYFTGMNIAMISYLVCKLMFTFHVRNCVKFMQSVYESLFLAFVTFQTVAAVLSQSKIKNLTSIIEELRSSKFYFGKTVEKYNRRQKWITILFASFTMVGVVQIFMNYKSHESKCDVLDKSKHEWRNKLYIELWLPYDETRPSNYAVTDRVVTALILASTLKVYIFSVIIPLFVLETSCHFKILADVLEKRLSTDNRHPDTHKVHFKEAIKYHQQILK